MPVVCVQLSVDHVVVAVGLCTAVCVQLSVYSCLCTTVCSVVCVQLFVYNCLCTAVCVQLSVYNCLCTVVCRPRGRGSWSHTQHWPGSILWSGGRWTTWWIPGECRAWGQVQRLGRKYISLSVSVSACDTWDYEFGTLLCSNQSITGVLSLCLVGYIHTLTHAGGL